MISEVDHEVTEQRNYPLTRLTSLASSGYWLIALAKNAEPHSSDAAIPSEKRSDKLRSSLTRILKAIVEEFGRNAESGEYYFLTRHSRAIKHEFEE